MSSTQSGEHVMTLIRPQDRVFIGLGTLVLLAAAGCHIDSSYNAGMGNRGQQARHEKIVERDTPLSGGSTLDVDTSSGSITIHGADVSACSVAATITGQAPSKEEAQTLAEQVEIRLQQTTDTLKIRADKPKLTNNRAISVSYAITVPRRTNVQCHSAYGSLALANLEGVVNAKTGSGTIEAEDIQGPTNLDSAYGSIRCGRIVGAEVVLHSGSGSITASDIKGTARMNSAYGSVKCDRFSDGNLSLKSGSGRVTVADARFGECEAISAYGSVTGSQLEGDVIQLRTSSGNVEITAGTAETMDLSSAYGSVRGTQIITSDLKAHSGSGNIKISCAAACPPELTADAKTAYGSIDFSPPTGFAGKVHLATQYGSVRTDQPITISGEITKKKIAGAIGEGQGHLRLETSSGSIRLK
jgi:DUF4097 and DUF4098 domain-containing protein YvlB